jgi:beta-aspartyl-dipeptidase (metallo-type)
LALLIRRADVYAPRPLGLRDILVAGGRIEAIVPPDSLSLGGLDVDVIEADGRAALPGLIDPHVHMLGGGGEGGPATRAPEIAVEDIAASGVTTVIGCLGTDGITRSLAALLAKARALEIEGLSTWLFAGSYELPVRTITGSVRSDLALIDRIVGAGEIALSDHRSSQPTFEDVAKLAAECRVGGLLGGKAGILHIHLGDGPRGLEYLWRLMRETEIPAKQVVFTHANRSRRLLNEAIDYVRAGGYADLTAGLDPEQDADDDISVETAVRLALERGAPLDHFTVSSDANGSMPRFDASGALAGLTIASPRTLLRKFRSLVRRGILDLERAAALFSAHPAAIYRLPGKGVLAPGADADLTILDQELELTDVIARGRPLLRGRRLLVHGTFARPDD